MIRSMTAFARQEYQVFWGQVCWELRSVNHRYLDISIRLPEELRRLEITLREHAQQHLKRGKVDCTLYFQPNKANEVEFNINSPFVTQLWESIKKINALTGKTAPPTALDILRWPGVLEIQSLLDSTQIEEDILCQFDNTLEQLLAHRQREGSQLATFIEQKCAAIADEIACIRQALPVILQAQQERLRTRLTELVELNSERLEQETVILAQKMDVAEELERLETHLIEIRQVLIQPPPIGRRLDFLVQELHREANTLGAKANHIDTTHSAIELKVLIEQMREQIQNIE